MKDFPLTFNIVSISQRPGFCTWSDEDVSNVVSDAYQQYEDMEFGTKTSGISDPNRHIKLISIAGKKVRLFHL